MSQSYIEVRITERIRGRGPLPNECSDHLACAVVNGIDGRHVQRYKQLAAALAEAPDDPVVLAYSMAATLDGPDKERGLVLLASANPDLSTPRRLLAESRIATESGTATAQLLELRATDPKDPLILYATMRAALVSGANDAAAESAKALSGSTENTALRLRAARCLWSTGRRLQALKLSLSFARQSDWRLRVSPLVVLLWASPVARWLLTGVEAVVWGFVIGRFTRGRHDLPILITATVLTTLKWIVIGASGDLRSRRELKAARTGGDFNYIIQHLASRYGGFAGSSGVQTRSGLGSERRDRRRVRTTFAIILLVGLLAGAAGYFWGGQPRQVLVGTLDVTSCQAWGLTGNVKAQLISDSGQVLASSPLTYESVAAPACRVHFAVRISPQSDFNIVIGPKFTYTFRYQPGIEMSDNRTQSVPSEGWRLALSYAS